MDKSSHKAARRRKRHVGVRKRVIGTPERPRLAVYKSLKHIYAQVIDDLSGRTLASASSGKVAASGNVAGAAEVGRAIAERAKAAGVAAVAFDRGGFKFHGRVRALAEAARKGGLEF